MKNFKRTLALVIAVIMVIGCVSVGVSAAGTKWYSSAVAFIESKGIAIIGADADKKVTRNDFVLWVAKLESRQPSDSAWNDSVASVDFSDVTEAHHRAAIAYSKMRGFIIGNGDGTFSPDKALSYAEACAVIVRMMGYENKVTDTSPANWAYNYMQVANTYAHAIDATFMKETDTYNPDYELSQGEAAYLLASIMNYGKNPGDSNFSTTADGINLGEYDARGTIGKAFYVVKMDRLAAGESLSNLIHLGGQKGIRYTNELKIMDGDVATKVVLQAVDGSSVVEIAAADFLKLVRISLGLNPTRDIANEEAEINVFATVDVGSIVNLVIDATTGRVTSLKASSGSVIVDTYLQATDAVAGDIYGNNSNGSNTTNTTWIMPDDLARYVGWTIREIVPKTNNKTVENTCPALPLSYDESKVTSWTNVVKDANGVVTSAVLNFRGQTYSISGLVDGENDEIVISTPGTIEVEKEDGTKETVNVLLPITADIAVKAIINAAQGEVQLVFNDEDGDGRYDSVIVKESDPFLYADEPNIQGSDNDKVISYYSSISNGTVLGTSKMKGQNIGAVIYNRYVDFAQGGDRAGVADYRTDGYHLYSAADGSKYTSGATNANTGKLQLILRASNKHFFIDGWTSSYGNAVPHFYKVVDLADFGVGIIEEVDAFSLNDYYIAKIRLTDNTVKQVYIPVTPSATATIPVTVAGATADYVFDSSAWCEFITKDMAKAIEDGIVSAIGDPGHKASTAAWMAGKYVQFATDPESKVICILGTESQTATSGFVTSVEKTATGDNTFNVTIAKSSIGVVSDTEYYLEAALNDGGEYRITTPVKYGGGSTTDIEVGKINLLNTTGIWYFQNAGTTSTSNNYAARAYNQSKHMLAAISGKAPHNTTIGLMNEALNSEIYNTTENRANGKVAAWKVDENGNVFDSTGKRVVYQYSSVGRGGVSSLTTVEVRANASSMFGWDTYETNHALFGAGKLNSPLATNDGKVTPGQDLIYVTVAQDAGSKYLLAGDRVNWTTQTFGVKSSTSFYDVKETGSSQYTLMRFWATQIVKNSKPVDSWVDVNAEKILSIKELNRTVSDDKSSYEATYEATVGFGPYYDRTKNDKGVYEYVLKFTSVVVYKGVTGTANAVIDTTKTVMIPLYQGATGTTSTQIKATTEADFAKYTIANGYYIDPVTSLVYMLVDAAEIVYKTDKDGNIVYGDVTYDWANGEVETTYTEGAEVLFDTYKLGKFATFTYKATDRNAEGWFPGLYDITLDGKTYSATYSTPVIIITPSADGFKITTTTLQNVPEKGLFVTTWNAAESYGKLTAIAVVGEAATEYSGGGTVEPPVEDKGTLVYLDVTAKSVIKATQYGKSWIVMADKSAYALPSGEDIGTIYREYSTYEEAVKAESIDISIKGGHWYKVDENGKILADVTVVSYDSVSVFDSAPYEKVTITGGWGVEDGADSIDLYIDPNYVELKTVTSGEGEDAVTSTELAWKEDAPEEKKALAYVEAYFIDATSNEVKSVNVAKSTSFATDGNYKLTATKTEKTALLQQDALISGSRTATAFLKKADGTAYVVYADKDNTVGYVVDGNLNKVETSAKLGLIQTGTLTSATASGQTIATMNGVKGVDISGYKFAFFYKNAEKTVLYKAGNSTNVSIANEATYRAQFASEQTAYNNALAAYEDALTKDYLSAERLAYYKAEVDKTEAALTAKKNSLLDRYFNGQFWNVPNSPYYQYVTVGSGSFQQPTSELTFNYVLVGDTYCVFSDEFILG